MAPSKPRIIMPGGAAGKQAAATQQGATRDATGPCRLHWLSEVSEVFTIRPNSSPVRLITVIYHIVFYSFINNGMGFA